MSERLFSKQDLDSALRNEESKVTQEVAHLSEERVLNTPLESLLDYFCEKYQADMPQIDEAGIHSDYGEVQIDVSGRFEYVPRRYGGPQYVTGTRFQISVPFTGDPDLFRWRPSTFTLSGLEATVGSTSVVFAYDALPQDTDSLRSHFDRDLASLKRNLSSVAAQVENFNSRVRSIAEDAIESRRDSLMQAQTVAQNLGFPLKRRADAPSTYAAPDVRRRVAPKLPAMTTGPGASEPTLAASEYEHILSVISNMVVVMERSPSAFRGMQEEDLRQHFLVQLNAQYEGQATAETFNFSGKTDILIRVDGKNIFVAECKFWRGPAALIEAVDQLLGYTTWRDTKTALLVFNRDTQMTTVLDRIPEAVEQHPNHKATLSYASETGFRYTLSHANDAERDLTLTVLVFDVPSGD